MHLSTACNTQFCSGLGDKYSKYAYLRGPQGWSGPGGWCIDGWCTGGWCLTDCGGPSGPEMSRPIFFPSQIASGFRTDLAPRPGPV